MLTAEQKVAQYVTMHGKQPTPQWLSVAARIPLHDAEAILGQPQLPLETPETPAPKVKPVARAGREVPAQAPAERLERDQEAPRDLIQAATRWIVLWFATLADLGLAMFFYLSLGFDPVSKVVLATWGFVQTSGKLWAWTHRRYALAAWSAALSVVATVSVFLAVIEVQSASVQAAGQDSSQVEAVKAAIEGKEAENAALRQRLASTPADYVSAANALTKAMAANDVTLAQLRQELASTAVLEPHKRELELDAWKIFSQLTNFAWHDPSHVFALVLTLAISILFEMLICATAPKKMF